MRIQNDFKLEIDIEYKVKVNVIFQIHYGENVHRNR